jgi:hypothetical protein
MARRLGREGLVAALARRQPNSIWLNSRSLSSGCRPLTKRTVLDRDFITSDCLVAPKSWQHPLAGARRQ